MIKSYVTLAIVFILALTALIFVWKMPRSTPFIDWWRERFYHRQQDNDDRWEFFRRRDHKQDEQDQDYWEPFEQYRRRWFWRRGDINVLRGD